MTYQADIWPQSSLPARPSGSFWYIVSINREPAPESYRALRHRRTDKRCDGLARCHGRTCPTRPVISGGDFAGDIGLCAKSESSFATKAFRPPKSAMYPAGSCCAAQVPCQEFDSVKSRHRFDVPVCLGSNGAAHSPFSSLGRMNPTDLSNRLR